MDRNKLRAVYRRAKGGESIPAAEVIEVLNYLATVEFEVDCQTLDARPERPAAEVVSYRTVPRLCYPGHVLMRAYPDGDKWAAQLEHRANGRIVFEPSLPFALNALANRIALEGLPETGPDYMTAESAMSAAFLPNNGEGAP